MENKRANQQKLWRLADALIDDVFAASDDEILAELDECGGVDVLRAEIAGDIAAAKSRLGRAKLAAARKAVAAERRGRTPRQRLSPHQSRRRLSQALAGSPASSRLTLAARRGQGVPDEDLDGLVEDATDLGINLDDPTEDSSDAG
jgi:hypothetical protein